MLGSVWCRWIGESVPIELHWPATAVRNARRSQEAHDPGPFGRSEGSIHDLRVPYQAAILGWLGMEAPDTLNKTTPDFIGRMQEPTDDKTTLFVSADQCGYLSLIHI